MKRIIATLSAACVLHATLAQDVDIYSLKSCLERGLLNNYSLRIRHNDEQTARNNATPANAGALPTLDLTGSYRVSLDNTESRLRATGMGEKAPHETDQTLDLGLALNWTLFDGFGIQTTYSQLKLLSRQGETETRIALEDFIATLAAEYYNFVQQKIRMKNLLYAVQLSKERLRIVEARYHIGDFSRLDYQQAKVDFNADSAQYMKQQELLHTSRIRLNELMGNEDVDRLILTRDSLVDVNDALDIAELWDATLAVNASLLKAAQDMQLARMDYKKVLARNYPYVRLNASYGYTHTHYGTGSYDRRRNLGLQGGVTVGLNLFDGNRRRERRNAAIAVRNARLRRDELELSLRADLSNLWQAYRNNLEMLALERQNLVAARDNHDIAMERYMLGDLSGIEMREAQKSLLDAEERILSAEYNTKLCEISLLQISGKLSHYLE